MSLAELAGANALAGVGWSARVLTAPPLIAPARQFIFPLAIAGEEEALARGALWLDVRVESAGAWLGQCALGFAGRGVAHGLWPLPENDRLLACAGGYAYEIAPGAPEGTRLLPPRPVVGVLALAERTVMVTHHGVLVRESGGELWTSPRLSWEGVTLLRMDGEMLHGLGWNMLDDAEVAFTLNLRERTTMGGGYVTR